MLALWIGGSTMPVQCVENPDMLRWVMCLNSKVIFCIMSDVSMSSPSSDLLTENAGVVVNDYMILLILHHLSGYSAEQSDTHKDDCEDF